MLLSIIIIILLLIIVLSYPKTRYELYPVHLALYEYLNDFDNICDKNNIMYFAESGTLLGAIRDGKIISHDDDIDVSMFEPDFRKLVHVMKNNDKYHIIRPSFRLYKFCRKDTPGVFIDIFIIQEKNNVFRYKEELHIKAWPKFYFRKDELFPLKKIKFHNQFIWIPNNPIPYLERSYGKNWKIPVKYTRH